MTRQEFVDGVTSWQELIDFCYEYDCGVCMDIVASDDLRDCIAEDFENFARDYSWADIRDWLNEIDEDAWFYCRSGSFEYEPVDDAFEQYKRDVLYWCDEDASIFDDEFDDTDDGYEDDEAHDEFSIEESEYTIDTLLDLNNQ